MWQARTAEAAIEANIKIKQTPQMSVHKVIMTVDSSFLNAVRFDYIV